MSVRGAWSAALLAMVLIWGLGFGANHVLAADLADAGRLQDAFCQVAEQSFPSVVVIRVRQPAPNRLSQRDDLIPEDFPFFFQFPPGFDRFRRQPRADQMPQAEGRGSGFVVREDGHILTNCHVVGDQSEVTVVLRDGRELAGKVVGRDPKTDLAVVKVEAGDKLPALSFADSDAVRVGQWAIAIGAPFNFDYTMTVGIVSQKGRSVGMNAYENYLQTDASINPGNSGGPLLDLTGKVIGINNFIITANSMTPGNIGLGFAIPSNLAASVLDQLISRGEVVRPWLGIAMQALTPEMKEQFKAERGVVVGEVFTGDPADRAGIHPGDVILKLDGQPINDPKDLQFGLLKHQPGATVKLTILRDGKEQDVEVVAGRQRDDQVAGDNSDASRPGKSARIEDFGLSLRETQGKLVIAAVFPGSPAALAGLQPGHEVYAINHREVTTLAEAQKLIRPRMKRLLLFINDGRFKRFVLLARD